MQKIIYGVTGEIASGKGTIAEYIVNEYQGNSYRFSDMLRDILNRLHLEHSRENLQKLSTVLRQNFGNEVMAKTMAEDVKKDDHNIIVVEGIRTLEDIKFLKELAGFKLIFVEASMERRYDRLLRRDENTDDESKSFDEFKKDHEQEAESKIQDLKNYADHVIVNEGEFRELYKKIDEVLKS